MTVVFFAGGLLASAAPALGQPVPDASSNTPATDAVGPRELQNFSLPGTTTKTADQPANSATVVNPAVRETVRAEPRSDAPAVVSVRHEPARQAVAKTVAKSPAPEKLAEASPPSVAATSAPAPQAPAATPLVSPSFSPPAIAASPATGANEAGRGMPILPWLIAAVALAGGVIFLLWRRNQQREAAVAGAALDPFIPASPVPPPVRPEAAPRAAVPQTAPIPSPGPAGVPTPPRRPSGIVASRLRPSLELAVQPLRCLVDDEQVTIEFDVELFNSGTAPARAVIAEASLFNASASQEQELAAFYAQPVGAGDRIDSLAPMRRLTFTSRVVVPRAQVQEYDLGGRKSFVPVLAFNALYEWSGGKGQSSLAYLLGRETRGDKLGPLHLDGGGRELRGLGARVLPTAVRT